MSTPRTVPVTPALSVLLCLAAPLAAPPPAAACTTFAAGEGKATVVGKSYDWHLAHGLLVVNKRGTAKQALVLATGVRPARWVSKYGSVTFNQYGREMPNGGLNERGLVVEIMWLSATRHGPLAADRDTVGELQWIQILLDTCATVDEAVAAARRLQVARIYADVHYLTCDAAGACASMAYLDGKLVVHRGEQLPARTLTNSTYAESARALASYRGFGGRKPEPAGRGSVARFVRASMRARALGPKPTVAGAFGVLDSVQTGDYTKWQIVYEPDAGRAHFREPGSKTWRTVTLADQDLACGTPVQVADIHGSVLPEPKNNNKNTNKNKNKTGKHNAPSGKPAGLVLYERAHNEKLIDLTVGKLNLPLPAFMLRQLALMPEAMTRCATPEKAR